MAVSHPAMAPTSLTYAQTHQTLQDLIQHWTRLPIPERQGIQAQIEQLWELQAKLESQILSVATFGLVNCGKSAVINALLGQALLKVGPLNGVTRAPQSVLWDPSSECSLDLKVTLVDTPGLNDVAGAAREQLSWSVAQGADLILFVIAGDLLQVEYQALLALRTLQKPILLVFNKIDLYPEVDQQAIYTQITSPRLRQLVSPEEIVLVAAAPKPQRVRIHWPEGQISYDWERPEPLIEPLQTQLIHILRTEGEDLLTLNVLTATSQIQEHLIHQQIQQQQHRAQATLWRWSAVKAMAIGLCPIPGLDLLLCGGLDLGLIWQLARLYHLPLLREDLDQFWRPVGIGLGILGITEVSSILIWGGSTPFSPGLQDWIGGIPSSGATGYLTEGVLQAAAALISTRWIQRSAQQVLEQSSDRPKLVIRQILAQLPPGSILSRLRQEVSQALGLIQIPWERSES